MSFAVCEACAEDIPRLVEMGKRFISTSRYAGKIDFSETALTNLMIRLIGHDDAALFVLGNPPCGMIGLHVFSHPISGESVAAELFWWVEPEYRGHGMALLSAGETWAKERGVSAIQMIAPDERVGRFYAAHGYEKIEEHFQKEL